MRQLNAQTAKAAEKALNTPEGKILTEYLIQAVGLIERTFIPDSNGMVDPYRAAIKDGERAIVSLIVKLQQGQVHERQD